MQRFLPLVISVVAVLQPAYASDPGQPLDCSDWVFNEPGLSCTVVSPVGELGRGWNNQEPFLRNGSNAIVDNTGATYTVRTVNIAGAPYPNDEVILGIVQLVRFVNGEWEVVANIADRDWGANSRDHVRPTNTDSHWTWGRFAGPPVSNVLRFDAINGRILIPLNSYCTLRNGLGCEAADDYGEGWWVAAIDGFAPLMEIFQSYVPTSGPLSFIVPTYPEGLPYADFFDTYWGDLAAVGDWSQAQPLQCGYPATSPQVGDYLTVPDTLPDPAPRQGYYFVTAVNYMGQRRYGRKAIGGQLNGRDPAVLPTCSE